MTPDNATALPAIMPGHVGSPPMRVIAAVPMSSGGLEIMVTVALPSRYRTRYGTARAYRDADGQWVAWAGRYDQKRDAAIRQMIERAGWAS